MRVIDPTTGELLRDYSLLHASELDDRLRKAHAGFLHWRKTDFAERAARLRALESGLRGRRDELARLMAKEMGKPLQQGVKEIEKCALLAAYYAEHAATFLRSETVETDASRSYVSYRPLGVLLAIMPWNFPFWQVMRHAAPALMAGNTVLLKHAPNVPGCASALQSLFEQALYPVGCFTNLFVDLAQTASVIRDPRIAMVSLTGSTRAGRAVAAEAGKSLKRSVLELGGSDPYVVLRDADLDLAAETCVMSRLINSGQTCISAKRFIVVKELHAAFREKVVALMSQAVMGDPLEPQTTVGPQARRDLRDGLHTQVMRSIESGAKVMLGCEVPKGPGCFYPPSVLDDVRPGMAAFDEELFGPVAAIVVARDEAEAIALANATPFGLGAAIFTADVARGERIAEEEIEAGACFVNTFVRSDPRLPFGGIGHSGYGRELARQGIHEMVNIKTVYVA